MKRISLIFAVLLTIILSFVSCSTFGGNATYNYSEKTLGELCERISKLDDVEKLLAFSLISPNFDDDASVTDSEYTISGVYFFNMVGGKTTRYFSATLKSFVCLNDPTISDSEIEIQFICNCKETKDFSISTDSVIELKRLDENSLYRYSLVVDGEGYATVEFSCTEELSEETLDELCERVLNNIVIINDN